MHTRLTEDCWFTFSDIHQEDGRELPNANKPHNNLSYFNRRTGNEESECLIDAAYADGGQLPKLHGGRLEVLMW